VEIHCAIIPFQPQSGNWLLQTLFPPTALAEIFSLISMFIQDGRDVKVEKLRMSEKTRENITL